MMTLAEVKTGRNDPCQCGSGKKYKRCHGAVVDIPGPPTITGPILPDHPLWIPFKNALKDLLSKGNGRPNHTIAPFRNPFGEKPIYAGYTVAALNAVGVRNENDILKNLFAFGKYGGVADFEVFFNVEKRFYNGTNPKGRKLGFLELMGLGDKAIFAGIIDKIANTYPEIRLDYANDIRAALDCDYEIYNVDWFAAPLDFKSGTKCSYARVIHRLMQEKTGLQWSTNDITPRIFLDPEIKNPVRSKLGFDGPYWLFGSNNPLMQTKYWGYENYCNLVEKLSGKITFIQYGKKIENEIPGTLSLLGQTSKQELCAAFRDCQGSVGGPGNHAHLAAAFKKPCLIFGGGVEGAELFDYPGQKFYSDYSLKCKRSIIPFWEFNANCGGNSGACYEYDLKRCPHWCADHPACMNSITPEMVANEILKYPLVNN